MSDVTSPPPDLPEGSHSLARILHLDLRRGALSLITIGAPIVVGLVSGQAGAGLVGGITGLLLALSDTEGSLVSRLGTTADVALGIAVGGLLGSWLASVQPIFWLVFFAGIFVAGLLNQVGKGPHFAVRFGAIAFAVIAGLPELAPAAVWYFAGAVALSLVVKFIDQTQQRTFARRRTLARVDRRRLVALVSLCTCLRDRGQRRALDRRAIRERARGVDRGHRAGDHAAGHPHHLGAYRPGHRSERCSRCSPCGC